MEALKSSSFNRTVIIDNATKESLARILKEAFFEAQRDDMDWICGRADEIVKTALNLGLTELADDLIAMT